MLTNDLKGWFRLSWAAASCLVAAGCGLDGSHGTGDAPQHWRFAIEETIGSVQHAYALKFKELIEQRSEGQIRVTVYPYGALGTSDQLTEQLDLGAIQFVMASPGHLGKLIPEVQVFLLHFLFSDDEELNQRVLDSDPELRQILEDLYARKRMQLLAVYSEGWQVWTTKRPVRRPADFRGMRFRVMTSPLLLAAFEAYGASPTPLPYSEVYSALQLNMIDGQENPVFAIQEMSFYEVTNWMIFPNHSPFITTAVTEQRFFDSLPVEQQELIREIIDELNEYIMDVQREFNAHRLDLIREAKPDLQLIHLSEAERREFQDAARQVREQFIRMSGETSERLIRRIERAIEAETATDEEGTHGWQRGPTDSSERPPMTTPYLPCLPSLSNHSPGKDHNDDFNLVRTAACPDLVVPVRCPTDASGRIPRGAQLGPL